MGLYTQFVNTSVNSPNSTKFKVFTELTNVSSSTNTLKVVIFSECEADVSTSCNQDADKALYLDISQGTIAASSTAATDIAPNSSTNLSIELVGNGSGTLTFMINGVAVTPQQLGLDNLDGNDTYVINDVAIDIMSDDAGTGTFITSSFDNFKINNELKDDFNDGLDPLVFKLPRIEYDYD